MLDTAAVDVDIEPGEASLTQQTHRAQQNLNAFVVVQQSEKAETIPWPMRRCQHRPQKAGALAVAHVADALGCDAPVHVMLDHEMARAGEMVHQPQMMVQP